MPQLAEPPRRWARPPKPVHRWWGVPLVAVSLVVVVTITITALLPAGLAADKAVGDPDDPGNVVREETPFARVPSDVQPVARRVSYAEVTDDLALDTDADGAVHFVTIREPAQSLLGYWASRPEPEIHFLTRTEKFGSQTPNQQREISLRMMRTSSDDAQYIALSLAGYDAKLIPGQVQVETMLCLEISGNTCTEYVPNAEHLQSGDTILSLDGETVDDIDDLTTALEDAAPGDTVTVTVDRIDDGEVTVEVELMAAPDEPDRAIIGFIPFDTHTVDLPFEINIDTGEIGGPSAGLAFTLTLLDELTEGDLLGGADVAVTGTIEIDGRVGAIGGLPQKASAVRQAGIDYLLVPASQSEESVAAAADIAGDDVEMILVADIDEALAALEDIGGDPVQVASPAPGGER